MCILWRLITILNHSGLLTKETSWDLPNASTEMNCFVLLNYLYPFEMESLTRAGQYSLRRDGASGDWTWTFQIKNDLSLFITIFHCLIMSGQFLLVYRNSLKGGSKQDNELNSEPPSKDLENNKFEIWKMRMNEVNEQY